MLNSGRGEDGERWKISLHSKARAHARNMVGQQDRRNVVGPNMLRAFAHHVVCSVATCWKLLDEV